MRRRSNPQVQERPPLPRPLPLVAPPARRVVPGASGSAIGSWVIGSCMQGRPA
ncbi:hypothetical protein [Methanoculleus sp. 10]|uniref:hypothetical protein n=1 Tax=Methanoculleus sp. 10 TaxID=430615 RepID=UPI0025FE17CD|nr:hypothetical protein [Methanoculleus sp. 10]